MVLKRLETGLCNPDHLRLFPGLRLFLRRYLRAVILVGLLLLLILYNVSTLYETQTLDSMQFYVGYQREYVEQGQTCEIPLLPPFHEEVLSYFKPSKPVRCRHSTSMLTYVDSNGFLQYNISGLEESGYSTDALTCTYKEFQQGAKDGEVEYLDEKPMTGMDKLSSDFSYIACWKSFWLPNRYSMYHAAAQRASHIRTFRDDSEVGVAVVGLDSVSRLNFMRQLPYTFKFLTEEMGAFILKGFNKVGHNTLPNIVPILTGSPPADTSDSMTFDDWPFIWNELNKDNVATFYGEDISWLSTFSWWGSGFKKKPTTHYFHPYWVAVDTSSLNFLSSNMCLGPIPKHRLYIEYLRSFFRTYHDAPTFMFSLENEPSHDYLNTVGVMDQDLLEFFSTSYKEGLFNRTILFVLGDHGNRMDLFRRTKQGKLEDFLPMVSVILPHWLARANPDIVRNLQINSKRLASSYDLYSTFVDVFQKTSFSVLKSGTYNFKAPQFGQSLFQPIPLNRTCKDAGIPEQFCSCEDRKLVKLKDDDQLTVNSISILLEYMNNDLLNKNSELWKNAKNDFERFLNSQDKKSPELQETVSTVFLDQCAKLTLDSVEEAESTSRSDGSTIVHLTFKTAPNDGLYEGRVEWSTAGRGRMHEDIVRTNRYGNQADCLPKNLLIIVPFVRSACFCV